VTARGDDAERFGRALLEHAAARGLTSATVVTAVTAWARQAWVDATTGASFEVDPDGLAAWVAQRIELGESFVEALTKIRPQEAALAWACGTGDGAAIAALEQQFGSHLEQALRGISDGRSGPEDVRQHVRLHLFVGGDGRAPAIEHYSGRGSLAAWLRVTSKRAALNATRRKDLPQAGLEPDAVLEGLALGHGDPELRFLKESYRQEFRAAFAEALGDLDVRQRTLVRLAAVDNASVRDIGRMYGVHHATAARWIAAAYGAVVDATKARLAIKLRASPDDVDSILSLIKSRLDASLARIRIPEE
jgi:RNA polymerase sigma-70 factor (ECF subfamily)